MPRNWTLCFRSDDRLGLELLCTVHTDAFWQFFRPVWFHEIYLRGPLFWNFELDIDSFSDNATKLDALFLLRWPLRLSIAVQCTVMHFNSVSWVFFTPKKLCNNWGSNEHYNILAYVCSINYSFISPLCLISTLGNSANTDSIHQAKFIPTLEINKKFYLQRQNLKWKYAMRPEKKWQISSVCNALLPGSGWFLHLENRLLLP